MRRLAFLLVLFTASPAGAADLPPGAIARLGDDRFRAGGSVYHLALSPNGKQFATARDIGDGLMVLTVWDAITGRPIHEQKVNAGLFKGFVWGESRPFAVVIRAETGPKDASTLFPDDFRVWDFADPKAKAPPVLPAAIDAEYSRLFIADRPERSVYTAFEFSADGKRVAAQRKSATGKHTVHVFELKATDTIAKLSRVGTIDLGAEGADDVRLSADGKTLVTFRTLATPFNLTATTWEVATGKPAKPVLAPDAKWLILTPDARAIVLLTEEHNTRGFDYFDLTTGKRRKLNRRQYTAAQLDGPLNNSGAFAFTPDGRELVVALDRKTAVIDLKTGNELGNFEGHVGTPLAVAANGPCIATVDVFGLVRLWDPKTLRPLHEAAGHRAPVSYVQLSPDGKRLLTWAPDQTIRLWDLATGKELRAFVGATDDYQPVFALNGTTVIYRTTKSLIARDLQTGLEVPLPENAKKLEPHAAILSTAWVSVSASDDSSDILVHETASNAVRRVLSGHRGRVTVLGFTPDGTKLLTAGGDHTVLVWDMRLAHVPLPEALKKETDAAKLWNTLATGNAKDAYLTMARLAREPDAAVRMAKLKLKPVAKPGGDTDASRIADSRAIELLEALDTADSRTLLKELAGGHADAFRTQEAKRALERQENVKGKK